MSCELKNILWSGKNLKGEERMQTKFNVGDYCEIKGMIIDIISPPLTYAVYLPYTKLSKIGGPYAIWIRWVSGMNLESRVGDIIDITGFVTEISYRFNESTEVIEELVAVRVDAGDKSTRHIYFLTEDYTDYMEGLDDR